MDEQCSQELNQTASCSILATPDYVVAALGGLNGPNMIHCGPVVVHGTSKQRPATPVYWRSAYGDNWKKFISAALAKYQGDPRVSCIRFGLGAGGEVVPMIEADTDSTCKAEWNAAGMSYNTWLSYTAGVVDYIGSLNPTVPIFAPVSYIYSWDQGTVGFANVLGAEAAKFHFSVGNSGYSGVDTAWNTLYAKVRQTTQTYMQPANDHLSESVTDPKFMANILAAADQANIKTYELYPDIYQAAYQSGFVSQTKMLAVRAALEAIGTPLSCFIDPNWSPPS